MSYKLHCPVCATAITPENINIQQTIAVCQNCGAVFNFADKVANTQKIKRRKAKQPDYLTKTETDSSVSMKMPLLATRGYKWGIGFLTVMMSLLYMFILFATTSEGDTSAAIIFSILLLPFIMTLAASFFAQQTISADTERLEHSYHLGGVPVYKRTIAAEDVSDVSVEEMTGTRESVAAARYNLFAEKYDERQEMLINNFPEDAAFYAQQVLSNFFAPEDSAINPHRLTDAIRIDEQDDALHIQDEEMLASDETLQS